MSRVQDSSDTPGRGRGIGAWDGREIQTEIPESSLGLVLFFHAPNAPRFVLK
jgi:hypothetical protein